MNQYESDKHEFKELFCDFSGIPAAKITKYLKDNNVRAIFEHPETLRTTPRETKRVNDLMRLFCLYGNLKAQEKTYFLGTSSRVGEYFVNRVGEQRDREVFYCAMLNTKNELIHTSEAFMGTTNEAPVYPIEIVKLALRYGAFSVILAHNHPGGSTDPSGQDIAVTTRVTDALRAVSIKVIDHIIVANGHYHSFAEHGLISA